MSIWYEIRAGKLEKIVIARENASGVNGRSEISGRKVLETYIIIIIYYRLYLILFAETKCGMGHSNRFERGFIWFLLSSSVAVYGGTTLQYC